MEFDTRLSAQYAGGKLDQLIERAHRDSLALVEKADVSELVTHFRDLRVEFDALEDKIAKLKTEVDQLSRDLIPTLFKSQSIDKTINIVDVGRVTVSVRWNASVVKEVGMAGAIGWARQTGNDGLIIETINSSTLTAFAKTEALEGRPLPEDVFNVSQYNTTSITKR